MSGSFKKDKMQDQIRDFLNTFLRQEVNDPRVSFVSVTKVELNKDNSVANVFWDTFDNSKRGDAKKAIESASSKLKQLLSKALKIRKVPHLTFSYDSQYDEEQKIEKLIANAKNSDEQE